MSFRVVVEGEREFFVFADGHREDAGCGAPTGKDASSVAKVAVAAPLLGISGIMRVMGGR